MTGQPAWRRDVLIAAAFVLVGGLLQWLLPDAWFDVWPGAEPGWLGYAPLLLAGLGQTQRRSRPVLALLVGVVAVAGGAVLVGTIGVAVSVAFTDLLICGVLYSTPRASWAVVTAAGLALAIAVGFALVGEGARAALRTAWEVGLVLGIPIAWGLEVRWHRGRAELYRERAEQAQRLAVLESAAAVAAERARMARELHDVIAGQLSGIAIQSEAALTLPDADPATLRRVLTTVRRDSVASLTEMRTMIGLLRTGGPARDDERTTPAGLDRLDELLTPARSAGLEITVEDRRRDEPRGGWRGECDLPAAVDLAALRIVQESLTNALKHAPGQAARLGLAHENGDLVIRIDNDMADGVAFGGRDRRGRPPPRSEGPSCPPRASGQLPAPLGDPTAEPAASAVGSAGTGTGLLGLGERARAVGGRFSAGPNGRTWSVRAELPLGEHTHAVEAGFDAGPTRSPEWP